MPRSRSRERERPSRTHYREPKEDRSRSRERSKSPERVRRSRSPTRKRRHASRSRSRSREHKRRHRSKSRSRERGDRKERRRRSRSFSSSSDSSQGSSHRKREKRHKRKGSRSRERRKEKRREKKERKDKKKKDTGTVPHWGKYGIISDTDIFTKDQEFRTWLVEERKINPETISKDQQKKEFSRFIEDFNTATLPHEKYYNMETYDRRMSALRQGEYLPPTDDLYDFNADLKAVSGAHKKKTVEQDSFMTKEQLQELRRVQQERNEIGRMKLLGMDVKTNFGVRMDSNYE
ncbi:hypothetical protein CPB83DRAFT_902433 [Crepidotus variabilis]|uniref:Uncharacterized protein n=1 Tax=Crepidotus variabilis TaxID=179855 RepID=A0A9P6ETE9_9AGAR|nr:hypothetical protein CPB83DRAFT_902433 [Crepidotus variabilis]